MDVETITDIPNVAAPVDLLAVVAHDLRQPIAAALTATQFVEECLGDPGADRFVRVSLGVAQRCMREALTLAADLLSMDQARTGMLSLRRTPVDVGALLADARALIMPHAESRHVEVRVRVPVSCPRPLADRDRLMQVLANLVGNAVRFAGDGGRVTLAASCNSDAVCITVSDTGPGVHEADLPHVFDLYWRAPRSASGGGAGLGLTIARWLVEAHSGQITAGPGVDGGFSVSFTIPLRD